MLNGACSLFISIDCQPSFPWSPLHVSGTVCQILSLPHLPLQSSGPGLKLTCLTFPTPVIVQCLRSDSSCFGHYNRSCLLTYQLTVSRPYNSHTILIQFVTLCIVAKWCVLEQKLVLRAYRKSYMKNRLVPK